MVRVWGTAAGAGGVLLVRMGLGFRVGVRVETENQGKRTWQARVGLGWVEGEFKVMCGQGGLTYCLGARGWRWCA